MADITLDQILSLIDQLSEANRTTLLERLQALQPQQSKLPPGTPGELLLARMDMFNFEPGELDAMAQAIEESCENIDWDSWQ